MQQAKLIQNSLLKPPLALRASLLFLLPSKIYSSLAQLFGNWSRSATCCTQTAFVRWRWGRGFPSVGSQPCFLLFLTSLKILKLNPLSLQKVTLCYTTCTARCYCRAAWLPAISLFWPQSKNLSKFMERLLLTYWRLDPKSTLVCTKYTGVLMYKEGYGLRRQRMKWF